ncbi:MAG: prealbumin-like fold domain-containing protein [Oscillospiraceae bacterium]
MGKGRPAVANGDLYGFSGCRRREPACGKRLTDGKLTSGADGEVRFTGLYSGGYRVTETKAPKGYQLLTEPVYGGHPEG